MIRRTFITGALAGMALPAVAQAANADPNAQEPTDMHVRFAFGAFTMTATLDDNASARDFYAMLPLDLTISDFAHNEKIAYLPRKLTEQGSGAFDNELPYDLCYYKPWGNLAMFHGAYQHPGLIRLGRFDQGHQALHELGEFALHIDALPGEPT